MKTIKYIFAAGLIVLLLACGKEEPKYTIPAKPVDFKFNTGSVDHNLANIGSISVYIKAADKNAYDKQLEGVKGVQIFIAPRLSGEYIGYSGLLIINTGSTLNPTPFAAFDLCCPHEKLENIRVVPANDGTAKCPKCGSVYDIMFGTGQVMEGVSSEKLQTYYVASAGNSVYRVFYY
jgi:hypothetical protein